MRHLFASVFEERLVEVYGDLDSIRCAPDSVLFGHFCFSLHKRLGDRAPSYMTVLRDPVDRVISGTAIKPATPAHAFTETFTKTA